MRNLLVALFSVYIFAGNQELWQATYFEAGVQGFKKISPNNLTQQHEEMLTGGKCFRFKGLIEDKHLCNDYKHTEAVVFMGAAYSYNTYNEKNIRGFLFGSLLDKGYKMAEPIKLSGNRINLVQ